MLILASKSPRRRELLAGLGADFTAAEAMGEEMIPKEAAPAEAVIILARQKAEEVFSKTGGTVIGADTVVVHEGRILGKPADEKEAFSMLLALSDGWHEVYTGLCVTDGKKTVSAFEMTRVKFRRLSEAEIGRYIETKEPLDKAGAYGIQGLGSLLVQRIEGDYFNVVGLPLCRLGILLKEHFDITLL